MTPSTAKWGKRDKVCIVMGNEDKGVSDELLSIADHKIYLPMLGFAESYNLSVATSLACAYLSTAGVLVPSTSKLSPSSPYRPANGQVDGKKVEEVRLKWIMESLPKAAMAETILRKTGVEIVDHGALEVV